MVIAVVYNEFGGLTRPIFLLLTAGLIEVGFFVSSAMRSAKNASTAAPAGLAALNEFNQAVSQAGFNRERIRELLLEYAQRVLPADQVRVRNVSYRA